MSSIIKRSNYFGKLVANDRVLKWLYENDKRGGMINLRLDQLRRYAGIDRFQINYFSPDFFKIPELKERYFKYRKDLLKKKLKTFQS